MYNVQSAINYRLKGGNEATAVIIAQLQIANSLKITNSQSQLNTHHSSLFTPHYLVPEVHRG